ncbi:hypothetical protein HDU92_005668, partial [Lobulomyces angularis]
YPEKITIATFCMKHKSLSNFNNLEDGILTIFPRGFEFSNLILSTVYCFWKIKLLKKKKDSN